MGRTGRRSGSLRNCLFLTTNPDAFMLALGVTHLWSQAWVEAARPPDEPWPIVGQQILVATLERGEWPVHEVISLLARCFPDLPSDGFRSIVEHMIQEAYLGSAEGLVRIGPRTEREFGRGHYRDLLASFSGAQLLTGRCGSAEVGYIDPTMLTGEEPHRLLLLAGRSWLVKEIEWSKRTVWLEPAKEGGKARWMGGARSLSREVCQGIRAALVEGPTSAMHLSLRGKNELAALQEELDLSLDADFMSRTEGSQMRTWTFAGTKLNRTYARAAAGAGTRIKFDALSVQAPAAALIPLEGGDTTVQLTDEELATFAEGVKFSSCVSESLLRKTITARMFAVSGEAMFSFK
jgi:ATP-dependent Lhr-like helicase